MPVKYDLKIDSEKQKMVIPAKRIVSSNLPDCFNDVIIVMVFPAATSKNEIYFRTENHLTFFCFFIRLRIWVEEILCNGALKYFRFGYFFILSRLLPLSKTFLG